MDNEQFKAVIERQARMERKIDFLAEMAIWVFGLGTFFFALFVIKPDGFWASVLLLIGWFILPAIMKIIYKKGP